ncbi:MAG: glycosyltransferase family 2 protein [Mariprofundus sp.]|nr:glycosyltransferase family 2 protein [Mariprofundus sp.]
MSAQICGLIPVYNNHMTIAHMVHALLKKLNFVIIVNDGSNDGTEITLQTLLKELPGSIDIVNHPHNCGKGVAVQNGLKRASELKFTHAIQVDADGQHDTDDLPKFITAIEHHSRALILGTPIYGDDIPIIRKYGRKLTQAMLALEMGQWSVPDGMIGYRGYPVEAICQLGRMDPRMSFDPEVLIRAHWAGLPLIYIPTEVRYPSPEEGGISHFKMVNDNVRHTWIHIRLILQAPFQLLAKAFRKPDE